MRLLFLTPRLPPAVCGVGDFTRHCATTLAGAGVRVGIATREGEADSDPIPGVEPFSLPLNWDREMFSAALAWQPDWVSLQWVPHLYHRWGYVPGAGLFLHRLARAGVRTHVMVHELWGTGGGVKQRIASALQKRSTLGVMARANRMGVLVPEWEREIGARFPHTPITCYPVGATILPVGSCTGTLEPLFGVLAPHGAGKRRDWIMEIVPRILETHPSAKCLFLAAHPSSFPEFADEPRCQFHPPTSASELSKQLQRLRVLVSPFLDGMSGRRTSVVSALAHGLPVITTRGPLTDSQWDNSPLKWANSPQSCATQVLELLSDDSLQSRVAEESRRYFQKHLTWSDVTHAHFGEFVEPQVLQGEGG